MTYFKGTFVFWLFSVTMATLFLGGMEAALIVSILAVLEVSLSFDNAVVNAKKLGEMDSVWRGRFLTWGMIIAVFGMRVVFPLLIVSVVAGMWPVGNPMVLLNPVLSTVGLPMVTSWPNALDLAIFEPEKYASTLTSAHIAINGFGLAFLMMVFLKNFFDKEKEVHWVEFIEKHLHHLEGTEIAVTLAVAYVISLFLSIDGGHQFVIASVFGVITYILVEWVSELLGAMDGKASAVAAAKTGLGAFIYLEILDASFSFDGVIGAFALSNNIFIIAMGLGVGAFAVRGLTLMLVEKGTLAQFRYLEHGAFYAIGALAVIMGISTLHEIPEVVTGLIGAGFIGLSLVSSVLYTRNNPEVPDMPDYPVTCTHCGGGECGPCVKAE